MSLRFALLIGLQAVGGLLLLFTLPLTLELLVLSPAACFPPRRLKQRLREQQQLAVVVPAHNEETLITACVGSLLADRNIWVEVYVVAHNCTDRTAQLAAEAGARVLPLAGPGGKGLALDHGFRRALLGGANGVLVIDADSVVSSNLVSVVAKALAGGADAVQTRYEVGNATSNTRTRLAALALVGMNVLRPRGRSRLGLSCGIFGNGFALSARTLGRVPYSANSLVEDLEYHLRLLAAGVRVDFLDDATVLGEMPERPAAQSSQRARWEGGRTLMRRTHTLAMVGAILRGELRLVEALLDLNARPLAMQVLLLILMLGIPLPWTRIYGGVSLTIGLIYVLVAAGLSPRPAQALKALLATPGYFAWKILMIPATRMASRKDAAWVRTERNG